MNEPERSLDPQLWHACAGGMVQMPTVNSRVFYFPQGHAEHASSVVDFASSSQIPPLILCRVSSVKFLADPESDEVFAKLKLAPLPSRELLDLQEDNVFGLTGSDNPEKPASFAKTLTQSDANNGGGFSVPRYCAETIFPRLDYSADPPVQTVVAKDVHGETWKFRHIYRGTPRRHLLTTGWSTFVNQKKLVAGDSIVFLRADNGELCVGIRRAKRGTGGDSLAVWSSSGSSGGGGGSFVPQFGGFSMLFREEESKLMRSTTNAAGCDPGFRGRGRVRPETVIEAATLAASGQPFEVVYYPRASTPEFCVKAASVKAAMRIHWCSGMRFKMAFETEDSSRISWFMGTISSVHVMDPIRWPNSPWRLLQVTWDEPDLLQNVKRVSPWLVELVSNIPAMHVPSFSPPRKKLRLPQYPDFQLDGNSMFPSLPGNLRGQTNLLCCLSDNAPARIQGARQGQFGIPLTDHHLNNRLRLGLLSSSLHHLDPHFRNTNSIMKDNTQRSESLMLTMGNSSQNLEKSGNQKSHKFLLFGQPILTEQQLANGCAADVVSKVVDGRSSSNGSMSKLKFLSDGLGSTLKEVGASFPWRCGFDATELSQETGHCKVFMESEDVGRTLDLSVLGSYEELYRKLANMFGIERSEMPSHVLYRDAAGTVRRTGDEPFSDFMRTAKRLTIFMDSGSHNIGRTLLTGMRSAENGFDSSTKAGPLSTFA